MKRGHSQAAHVWLARLGLMVAAFLTPVLGQAQDYARWEIGLRARGMALSDAYDQTFAQAGVAAGITYNFSSLLSLDTEGTYFLRSEPGDVQRGGRALLLVAGPRASWRKRRVSLFVNARPAILSFSSAQRNIVTTLPNGSPLLIITHGDHRTHFALALGADLEFNTSSRTFIRFDVDSMLLRYGDQVHHIPGTSLEANLPGFIGQAATLGVGFGYRLGDLHHAETLDEHPGKWEAGAQYTLLNIVRASEIGPSYLVTRYMPFDLGDDRGVGGRITYNLNRWLALDSAVTYFYTKGSFSDAQRGGRMLEAVAGIKAGVRTRKFGFFAKLRPGILSYGQVYDNFFPPPRAQRLTHMAADTGGVLECYLSHHAMLRFDLGFLGVHYGPVKVTEPPNISPVGTFTQRGFNDSGIQLSSGFGWRF